MESNREVFLRMSEEHYLTIPSEVRESFLRAKRVDKETGDWKENMKDEQYSILYGALKIMREQVEEREYQLREERRKQLNK